MAIKKIQTEQATVTITTNAKPARTKRAAASRADRKLAESVARYLIENSEPGERIDPMIAFPCIAGAFPGISLETALVGFVFRDLLIPPAVLQ